MVCIHCSSETQVVNSRPQKRSNQIWRRRKCLNCLSTFTTLETADYSLSWVVQPNKGSYKPFSRDKLLLSLYRSLQHRKEAIDDAAALTDTTINKLRPQVINGVVASRAIQQVVIVALNRFDGAASVHYQAFHRN
jgi:transcriptional regulator NrdR family protein